MPAKLTIQEKADVCFIFKQVLYSKRGIEGTFEQLEEGWRERKLPSEMWEKIEGRLAGLVEQSKNGRKNLAGIMKDIIGCDEDLSEVNSDLSRDYR